MRRRWTGAEMDQERERLALRIVQTERHSTLSPSEGYAGLEERA